MSVMDVLGVLGVMGVMGVMDVERTASQHMSKAEELEIHTEDIQDGIIVRPTGEIDLSCAAVLRQRLGKIQESQPARLVIDLSAVPYMDSSTVLNRVVKRRQMMHQPMHFLLRIQSWLFDLLARHPG